MICYTTIDQLSDLSSSMMTSLTNLQRNKLEAIQKRARRIISGHDCQMVYEFQCAVYRVDTFVFKLDLLSRVFL